MADRREQRGYYLHDYPRAYYYAHQHFVRHDRYVQSHGLFCQACGGQGEVADDYVEHIAIMVGCGWCEGTGFVTRWMRGHWLRHKQEEGCDG